MLNIERKIKEIVIKPAKGCISEALYEHINNSEEPFVVRGLVKHWPLVQAGLCSNEKAIAYINSFYNNKTVQAFFGSPDIQGRFFYNESMTGLNFDSMRVLLSEVLEKILQHKNDKLPPSFYVGSTTIDACLPGLRQKNDLNLGISQFNPLVSIWIGNASRIACHYDAPANIACSIVGNRKFIVFPPDQINNLYIGPIDFTPAGQPTSIIDFANPDFNKYPKFHQALETAQVTELQPGDIVYLPSMWWHHVEAFNCFNVLINYWWRTVPNYMGPAMNALHHAILSIRELPNDEKQAWKNMFDYYIFSNTSKDTEHIPEHAQGILASLDDTKARQLRATIMNKLNR